MLEKDEETGDTNEKTSELQNRVNQHNKQCPMMSFDANNTEGNKRKRPDSDVDDRGTCGGAGGSATEYAELGAHGYEVESPVILDEDGHEMMVPIMRVRQHLSTYATG
jgi:hypothetical protein